MNLLDLMVKIGVKDEASAGIKKLSSSLTSGLAKAAKAGIIALGTHAVAAAGGVAAIGKSALEAYASYEQLEGGIKKLFGPEAQGKVMEYAERAYQTAGVSANTYMEQVTSFSASLISSLGGDTVKAADYADRAMRAMSDNADTFGTDISSIQMAYQGFAKQNYTMLDNLKLGYGGTKEEMARLVKEASTMTDSMEKLGVTVDADSMSFDNIVNAIAVVQQEMGVAGTTFNEACTTIEGSVRMARSAWENWLTGLGNDSADMGKLTTQLVESITIAASNVVPRLALIMSTAATVITEQLPVIVEQIKSGIESGQPSILAAAGQLFMAILNALLTLAPVVLEEIGVLLQDLLSYVMAHGDKMAETALELFMTIVTAIMNMAPQALALLGLLLANLVVAIGNKVGQFFSGAVSLLSSFVSGIGSMAGSVASSFMSTMQGGIDYILSLPGQALSWGRDIVNNIANGIRNAIGSITSAASDIASTIRSFLHFSEPDVGPLSDFHTYMPDMMEGIADGMIKGRKKVQKAVGVVAGDISNGLAVSASTSVTAASGGTYNFSGITINATDRSIEEVMDELIAYANRSRVMMGVR